MLARGSHAINDLVTQIIALAAAGRIWPVGGQAAALSADTGPAARINAVVRARIGRPDEVAFLALPWGTAIELTGEQLPRYRDLGEMPAPFANASGSPAAV
jgi:hypothetical protein